MLWIIYLLVLNIIKAEISEEQEGLYTAKDNVKILNGNNFYITVYQNQENVWLVEFYNQWCGHCIKFAPVWQQLAKDIKDWNKVVRVGAVNCAEDMNRALCRDYSIQGYPTVKIFPPGTQQNDLGTVMDISSQDQEYDVRRKLVKYLTNSILQQPSWPILTPIRSVDEIWNDANINSKKYIVLLAEYEGSFMGREVILDFASYPELWIRRILDNDASKIGITQFPSLVLMNKDGTYNTIGKGVERREDLDRVLFQLIDEPFNPQNSDTNSLPLEAGNGDSRIDEQAELQPVSEISDSDHMQDLESALHYSFRQEIAMHKTIEADSLQALKNFVMVLSKYFPGRDVVKHYLWRMNMWIHDVKSSLTGEEWMDKTVSEQSKDAFLPELVSWTGCHGSRAQYRGYPCGMWMLFHTLTVSAYVSGRQSPNFNPKEVLLAVKGYMTHFFGCDECSKNFGRMAATIDMEVTLPKDSVLWLWRAHNKANKRLHGDESEDPSHPKIQFPSSYSCPDCCTTADNGIDLQWDEDEVLKFLVRFYSNNIIHDEKILEYQEAQDPKNKNTKTELDWWERKQRRKDLEKIQQLHLKKREKRMMKQFDVEHNILGNRFQKSDLEQIGYEEKSRGARFGWGFNSIDLGMCVLFYVMCTVIILLAYYHFMIRRNMKPCSILPF
ncbi:hypothetical protein ScPMuIL_011302 [Solemya velum]